MQYAYTPAAAGQWGAAALPMAAQQMAVPQMQAQQVLPVQQVMAPQMAQQQQMAAGFWMAGPRMGQPAPPPMMRGPRAASPAARATAMCYNCGTIGHFGRDGVCIPGDVQIFQERKFRLGNKDECTALVLAVIFIGNRAICKLMG
jgi:hypothetical protein